MFADNKISLSNRGVFSSKTFLESDTGINRLKKIGRSEWKISFHRNSIQLFAI